MSNDDFTNIDVTTISKFDPCSITSSVPEREKLNIHLSGIKTSLVFSLYHVEILAP